MKLTEHELASPLWRKLKEHWEARMEQLRSENDKNLNEIETARLRGRIAEVKASLDIGTPKPVIGID